MLLEVFNHHITEHQTGFGYDASISQNFIAIAADSQEVVSSNCVEFFHLKNFAVDPNIKYSLVGHSGVNSKGQSRNLEESTILLWIQSYAKLQRGQEITTSDFNYTQGVVKGKHCVDVTNCDIAFGKASTNTATIGDSNIGTSGFTHHVSY